MCVCICLYIYICDVYVDMYVSMYMSQSQKLWVYMLYLQLICASPLLLLQIGVSGRCIMSSCVKPIRQHETDPVVLLHCFDRF